jgi:hypothetical protein
MKALGRIVVRFPAKAVGAMIATTVVVFSGGWTVAKLLTPPQGERERAALEAAYRRHNLEIPRETDLVFVIEDLSKHLEDRNGQAARRVSAGQIGSESLPATQSLPKQLEESRSIAASPPGAAEAVAINFSARVPFPENFDQVVPGMKLSEAHVAFPKGRLDTAAYFVKIDVGPFDSVAYRHSSLGADPVIEAVIFFFRDGPSGQAAMRAVLERFGDIPHESEVMGSRLSWPVINGFQLTLENETYRVTLASTGRRAK